MKKIKETVWLHKSALNQLMKEHKALVKKVIKENKDIDFDVVRLNIDSNEVALIRVEDWDNQLEPVLVDGIVVRANGEIVKRRCNKNNSTIFHQKELFVNDNYKGFDLKAAEQRTELLKSLGIYQREIRTYNAWVEQMEKSNITYSRKIGTKVQ